MNKDKVVDISNYGPATVFLQSYGQYKVPIIKVIKDQFGLGLADAKSLVENAPCEVGSFTSRAAAERLKSMLEGAGATVELH